MFSFHAGFICSFSLLEDTSSSSSSSIGQLQRVLMALLKESSTRHIPLLIQLASLDSLLEICPVDNPSSAPVVAAVRMWLGKQMQHPWGPVLRQELEHKLALKTSEMAE